MPSTLSFGSRGPAVVRLQLLLSTRGVAPLVPDGIFGVRTRAAVVQAQHNAGMLPASGDAGPLLLDALRATKPAAVEVPMVRTPLSPEEMRDALSEGHLRAFGVRPSEHRLRIAMAQCGVEHFPDGRAVSTYCIGNVMTGRAYTGPWFVMSAKERTSHGWEVHKSHWRAYAEPAEGGEGYWRMWARHFGKALELSEMGTPEDVAAALKEQGYFTARLEDYAALMRAVWDSLD